MHYKPALNISTSSGTNVAASSLNNNTSVSTNSQTTYPHIIKRKSV